MRDDRESMSIFEGVVVVNGEIPRMKVRCRPGSLFLTHLLVITRNLLNSATYSQKCTKDVLLT